VIDPDKVEVLSPGFCIDARRLRVACFCGTVDSNGSGLLIDLEESLRVTRCENLPERLRNLEWP